MKPQDAFDWNVGLPGARGFDGIRPSATSFQGCRFSDFATRSATFTGDEVDACSWVMRRKGQIRWRRFDHIFASDRLQTISCEYLTAWREARLSDHAAIEAVFEV
jgi:endonuclease/exonuclease/phosphatase family metal-dependent hydrolase